MRKRWPQLVKVFQDGRWRWRLKLLDGTFWRLAWRHEDLYVRVVDGAVLMVRRADGPPQDGEILSLAWGKEEE